VKRGRHTRVVVKNNSTFVEGMATVKREWNSRRWKGWNGWNGWKGTQGIAMHGFRG